LGDFLKPKGRAQLQHATKLQVVKKVWFSSPKTTQYVIAAAVLIGNITIRRCQADRSHLESTSSRRSLQPPLHHPTHPKA
jgi:hypothetical protein